MKNSRGFGLVEVTVALGMLSGIILLFTNLNKQTSQAVLKNRVDQELVLTMSEMVSILSDPNDCTATLGGKSAVLTQQGLIESISHKGQKKYIVGSVYGESNVKVNGYAINSNDKNVSLANNTTNLEIYFQRKKMLAGSGDIVRKIKLYVKTDGGETITYCRSLSSASADIWTRGDGDQIYYSGGNVGINNDKPKTVLDVNGELKVASSGTACSSNNEGSIRYNAVEKNMEFCNGSEWKPMGNSDFNKPPRSESRFCVLMNTCPNDWLDRGIVGILSNHRVGFSRCENNMVGATGPSFGDDFVWCYPRLCCNN